MINFIRKDSGKKSIVLGIDESHCVKNPTDLTSNLVHLITYNRDLDPPKGRVFLFITSLSAQRLYHAWLCNSELDRSGQPIYFDITRRFLLIIPLPLLDPRQLLERVEVKALLDKLHANDRIPAENAIRLTAGHPRTLSYVLYELEQAAANNRPIPDTAVLVRVLVVYFSSA